MISKLELGAHGDLPRAAPSEAGVNADEIVAFLADVEAAGLELHGMMLHKDGAVIAEGWTWPYGKDRPRVLHSVAKSVTACAVGLALEEGRFTLQDKVISFFPDDLPEVVDEKLAAMSVEDLLTMRTGHASQVSGSVWRSIDTSWIREFFKIPLVHQPGTVYVYTSAASYMLSAILTRTTGQTMHAYLKPRFFEPLGIEGEQWEIGPDGVNPGGNGWTAKTEDLLKLGVLYEQGGMWAGKRVLPQAWVSAATQAHAGGKYGYHWFVRPDGVFNAVGVFVQMCIVFPAYGATLAITGAMERSAVVWPIVERHFPKAFVDVSGASAAADARLQVKLAAMQEPHKLSSVASTLPRRISGVTYDVAANPTGVSQLRFEFSDAQCVFTLTDHDGAHTIAAGIDAWIESETDMPGRDLHHGYSMSRARVVAGAHWLDETTLEMSWIFAETAFRDTVICQFEGERVIFKRSVNVNGGALKQDDLFGLAAAKRD